MNKQIWGKCFNCDSICSIKLCKRQLQQYWKNCDAFVNSIESQTENEGETDRLSLSWNIEAQPNQLDSELKTDALSMSMPIDPPRRPELSLSTQ